MTDGPDRVRAGILGAPVAPHLQVIEGGGGKNAVPPSPAGTPRRGRSDDGGGAGDEAPTAEGTFPLVALGHEAGTLHFLDIVGQKRALTARQIGSRSDLGVLFGGEMDWLRRWFPKKRYWTEKADDGSEVERSEVVGVLWGAAAEALMRLCREAGLYGPHVVLRGRGVWRGADGSPVVHVGDRVLLDGVWRRAGRRDGDQVWQTESPGPRPGGAAGLVPGDAGFAAGADVAHELQARIGELWSFRNQGGPIMVIGLMAIGYFGAATRWRSNGYLIGGTGSGKSLLLDLLRACVPAHSYSTDTSKSGIENAIDGKPTGVFLDEAGDRIDQRGAQMLLDLVLSASSNEGTRGLRGTADGKGRSFQVVCNVIMATVNPPDMQPQHRDRFSIIGLRKPEAGASHRKAMEAAIAWAKTQGPLLWGRALEAWDRWEVAREAYSEALAKAGCAAREMDQLGAILASWWVLVEDGVPSPAQALDGVGAIGEFMRGAAQVALEDGPRRMLQHLAGQLIQRDRSTDVEQVGVLVAQAYDPIEGDAARRLLERNGIRVIRGDEQTDRQGRTVPRGGPGDGLWFGRNIQTLRALFGNTVWDGDRWTYELARHPSAVEWRSRNVRIGGVVGPAIWLSRADWDPPDTDL